MILERKKYGVQDTFCAPHSFCPSKQKGIKSKIGNFEFLSPKFRDFFSASLDLTLKKYDKILF